MVWLNNTGLILKSSITELKPIIQYVSQEMASLISVWHWVLNLLKIQTEAWSGAWGHFWREVFWWRTLSGLIKKRQHSLLKSHGVPTSCGHVASTKPCKDERTDGPGRVQGIENFLFSLSWLLSQVSLLFSYTHFCLVFSPCFMRLIYFLHHLLASNPPCLSPPSTLAIFFFKAHTSFSLNPLQVHLLHLLVLCWDTTFPHILDKT